jgi:hypothetical protein
MHFCVTVGAIRSLSSLRYLPLTSFSKRPSDFPHPSRVFGTLGPLVVTYNFGSNFISGFYTELSPGIDPDLFQFRIPMFGILSFSRSLY